MGNKKHGIKIGLERTGARFYLSIKATGKLTHDDYEVLLPMIENSLKFIKEPEINVFFDATDFEGWEARAAWDDFKLGLKYGNKFNKIALLGNERWHKASSVLGSWFISGEIKYFEDESEALKWLENE